MTERFIDLVYQSVIGELQPDFAIRGIENSFAPGSMCDTAYNDMLCAYARLAERLGVHNEDEDLETILHCMTVIQKEIAYQMYRYGVHFGIVDQID